MNKILLTISLLLVFGTSAFVSVSGLSAVFSSAGVTIILMGCGMELGKILTVMYLHRRWKALHWLSRGFYITVIACLVLLTSAEVLGFLSKSHVQGSLGLKSNHASLIALNKEETILRDRIATIDKTLSGLPDSYVTKRIRERENAGYEGLQARLTEVIKEKSKLERLSINTKAYSAPIFAAARIFDIDETRAASLFIFFLVAVLEPLSIGLALAVSIVWVPVTIGTNVHSEEKLVQVYQKEEKVPNGTPEQKQEITDTSEGLKKLEKSEEHGSGTESTDPVTASIIWLIDNTGGFVGTVSELFEALNTGKNGWPEDAHSLGKKLRSLEQELTGHGIYVKRSRTAESRRVEIGTNV